MAKSRAARLIEMADEIQRRNEAFAKTPEGVELDLRLDFATRLLKLMKRRGLTKSALCQRVDMKPPQFSRIVQGDANITLETLHRLAMGLGVPPSRLLPSVKPERTPALAEMGK